MTARVLATAVAVCSAFWALMVAVFGWWAVVTITAIAAALTAYIAVARSLRPPLPQRQPGAALEAAEDAVDKLRDRIAEQPRPGTDQTALAACRAIWNTPQHTHPHRKEN